MTASPATLETTIADTEPRPDDGASTLAAALRHTVVVLPAYNAERTLERVIDQLPAVLRDSVLLVDDASHDETVEEAKRLGLRFVRHAANRGYGGNQKTCYREALALGARYVVMLHPDDQYDGRVIPVAVELLRLGIADVVLGNRIRTRREALDGGMPPVKYFANRGLTLLQNMATGQNLGEWHSGFRAYRAEVLQRLPLEANDDGFVFDSQFLLQCVEAGVRIADVPVPVRYHDEMSSISLLDASRYAVRTLWWLCRWRLHRLGLWPCLPFQLERVGR